MFEPFGVEVFEEFEFAGGEGAEVVVEDEVEVGVVNLNGADELVDGDVGVEFFFDFADEGGFGGFAGLDFAAGEFPLAFVVAVAALGGEDFVVGFDDGGDDVEGFHFGLLLVLFD